MPKERDFSAKDLISIKRTSVSEQVFEHLRNDIFRGKFEPGEPLKEMGLALAFGVSQSSVRTALHSLAELGLVIQKPHRGSYITTFTPKEMVERVKVRLELESYAAVEAKRRIDAGSLALLRKMATELDRGVKAKRKRPEIMEQDFGFHRTLWQMSGNETLQNMLEALCAPLFAFVLLKMLPYGEPDPTRINPHIAIVESIADGSPTETEKAMRKHITSLSYPFLSDSMDWKEIERYKEFKEDV